jgi:N-acetylglutamate synthase-like GNAT family acetyltransferase
VDSGNKPGQLTQTRRCHPADFSAIYETINSAAQAYRSVIPADRWHDPYMSTDTLESEIKDGVEFWGIEQNNRLVAVMGIQDKEEVTLIRHAYVRPNTQKQGMGTRLLRHFESLTKNPVLVGTWAAARWAISFYQKNGYQLVSVEDKNQLLKKYWNIPERQIETSVVLADHRWQEGSQSR